VFTSDFFEGPWHQYVKENPVVKFTLEDGSSFNVYRLATLEDVVSVQIYDDGELIQRLFPYECIRFIDILPKERRASALGFQS